MKSKMGEVRKYAQLSLQQLKMDQKRVILLSEKGSLRKHSMFRSLNVVNWDVKDINYHREIHNEVRKWISNWSRH